MSENSNDDMGLGGLGNADFLAGLGDLSRDMPNSNSDSNGKDSDNSMLKKASEARVHMANSMMAKNKSSNDAETDKETSEAFSTDDNDDTDSTSNSDENSSSDSNPSNSSASQSSESSETSDSNEVSSESDEDTSDTSSEDSSESTKASSSSDSEDSSSVDDSDKSSTDSNSDTSSGNSADKESASQSDKPQNSAQSHATKEFKALLDSKEAAEKQQEASNAKKIIANNDVTSDGQDKAKALKTITSLDEDTAQENLKKHALPQAAMEDLDSPQAQLNKAKGAHKRVTGLLKKAKNNGNQLNGTEFAELILYSNQSFNDLYGSMVKDRQQSKYRLDSLENRIKNMATKADEGSSALATLKEEGTFSGVSQDISMLSKIMDDPRIQEFAKQKHLDEVPLPKPLAQENKKAKDVDYERDQAKQKAEKSSN